MGFRSASALMRKCVTSCWGCELSIHCDRMKFWCHVSDSKLERQKKTPRIQSKDVRWYHKSVEWIENIRKSEKKSIWRIDMFIRLNKQSEKSHQKQFVFQLRKCKQNWEFWFRQFESNLRFLLKHNSQTIGNSIVGRWKNFFNFLFPLSVFYIFNVKTFSCDFWFYYWRPRMRKVENSAVIEVKNCRVKWKLRWKFTR